MPKVLVIATSRKTRGGITSVVKAHETGQQWKTFHCRWIETHRDGPAWRKIGYLLTSILEYILVLPFYDIVHIHIATPVSAWRKRIFFEWAKLFGKKTIFHFHPSDEKFLFVPSNRKLYRNLFSRADLVLVLSEQWRRWIKQSLNLTKNIEVLYNPSPVVVCKPEHKKKEILFAGTIIPRKGYADLICGFAKIAHLHPDWSIVFAGNGEIEKAKYLSQICGIEHQVKFVGWVDGEEKEKTFRQASIYCLASNGEGFPMCVLDAWAYGIPCVVTPVGGLPDIVKDGHNALVFKVGDINQLSIQLDKIISDRHLRERLSIASLKLAHETFNIENINRKLGAFYKALAG